MIMTILINILLQQDTFSFPCQKGEWENDNSLWTMLERWRKFLWLRVNMVLRHFYIWILTQPGTLLYDLGIGFITSLSLRSPICKIRIIKPTLQGFCEKNKTSVKYLEQKRHSVKMFAIIIIIFSITIVIILYFFPFCKFQPWQWRKKRPVPSQQRRWGLWASY